jgi:hypothetical protein
MEHLLKMPSEFAYASLTSLILHRSDLSSRWTTCLNKICWLMFKTWPNSREHHITSLRHTHCLDDDKLKLTNNSSQTDSDTATTSPITSIQLSIPALPAFPVLLMFPTRLRAPPLQRQYHCNRSAVYTSTRRSRRVGCRLLSLLGQPRRMGTRHHGQILSLYQLGLGVVQLNSWLPAHAVRCQVAGH